MSTHRSTLLCAVLAACSPGTRPGHEAGSGTSSGSATWSTSGVREPVLLAASNDLCILGEDGGLDCVGVGSQEKRQGPYTRVDLTSFDTGCGIDPDGAIACWGLHAPEAAPEFLVARDIGVGDRFACALDLDGMPHCWGTDAPNPPPFGPFVEIDAGPVGACAREASGVVTCFGDVLMSPPGLFETLVVESEACGVQTDGTGLCWTDQPIQIPDETWSVLTPECGVTVDGEALCFGQLYSQGGPPEARYVDVVANEYNACGMDDTGTVRCWGLAFAGQLDVPAGPFVALEAGGHGACALDAMGAMTCWGDVWNGLTALPGSGWTEVALAGGLCGIDGSGSVVCDGVEPPPAPGPFHGIDVNADTACAIDGADHAVCWGDSHVDATSVPARIDTVRQIAVRNLFSCVLGRDWDALDCWWLTSGMPLGDRFERIAPGEVHGCGIELGTHELRCWGAEYKGRTEPPAGVFTALDVAANHGCALDTDGAVHCWGVGGYGQTQAPPGTFVDVSVGEYHSCALAADGSVTCWGPNETPFE